jgi:ribosomal protein S18 acetylase RimI-like enzyme
MSKEGFELVEREPTSSEYRSFRQTVGWSDVSDEGIAIGLKNALYSVVRLHHKKTIGCGRVVGDGGIYFYVQDIIVLPEYRGLGLGRLIMDKVMDYLRGRAKPGAFIGLMAAKSVARFYERYGFEVRPDDAPGMAMRWEG